VPDRLRALLERPLDPRAGRAVTVLAAAISLGFATALGLGVGDGPNRSTLERPPDGGARPSPPLAASSPREPARSERHRPPRQDPQDDPGSEAGRRARAALRSHRALQHVPYRAGGVAIDLVGADGGRAVLRISAESAAVARRGWRAFLRRFDDDGLAYEPIFTTNGGRRG